MQITFFSLLMSVIWSSALIILNHICRKKPFFIREFGVTNLLCLYLFSMIRMMVPYEFSFARILPATGAFNSLHKSVYIDKMGFMQMSFLSILAVVWMGVAATLVLRFIFRYRRAAKEFSSYAIREDEQCRRIFNCIVNESGIQAKINIRRSKHIHIPMGVGIFHKSILLPDEDYDDTELYYILRHEFTHFKNHDLVIKILIHIFCCIYWWNPMVYLLKKDMAQALEIKCDLDVTDSLEDRDKAEYLATIVTVLRSAGKRRRAKAFYGATALVAGNYEMDVIERFKLVSDSCVHNDRNRLLCVSWIAACMMLMFVSYAFAIHPDHEEPRTVQVQVKETENEPCIIGNIIY